MKHEKDCLFCQMVSGQVPVVKVYEDDVLFCIRDIYPQAKIHLLVIPKEHCTSLIDCFGTDSLMENLFKVATRIAQEQGLWPGGFRCVINSGRDAGQSVFHLHLHVMGGESLGTGFGA